MLIQFPIFLNKYTKSQKELKNKLTNNNNNKAPNNGSFLDFEGVKTSHQVERGRIRRREEGRRGRGEGRYIYAIKTKGDRLSILWDFFKTYKGKQNRFI